MKTISPISNQKGFFAIGLGLAMLAAFGLIGITTNRTASEDKTAAQMEPAQAATEQQVVAQNDQEVARFQ